MEILEPDRREMSKNLVYNEGSLFVMPLGNGGYARGVVAGAAPRGTVLFGCFLVLI